MILNRRFRLTTVLVAVVLSGAAPACAEALATTGWGLPQLMSKMREVRSATARFTEQKFVRVLKQPLLSSGRLTFVAPDRLQKETLAPVASRLTVKGDRLTLEQPDGVKRDLTLSEYPEIGALVESVRATLAGDDATLTRFYKPTLTGNATDWSLQLEPRSERLRNVLSVIRILGKGNKIHAIGTIEREGDRTEMTITPDP